MTDYSQFYPSLISGHEYEPVEIAMGAINNLVWQIRQAKKVSELAVSWRNYNVGAAAIAYDPDNRMYGTLSGQTLNLPLILI